MVRPCSTPLFALLALGLHAQQPLPPYKFPDRVPTAYAVDAIGDYERLAKVPYRKAGNRDLKRFAELTAYGKKQLLSSGAVYYDPPEAERYLQAVADGLVKGDHTVKVFLNRNAEVNAYAIHDGSLFVNVGLLAEMTNEAALACVMGHEVTHYVNDDNRNTFFSKLKLYTRKNRNKGYELRIDKAHEDRTMEHIADSTGFLLARAAGYDLSPAHTNFLLFIDPRQDSLVTGTAKDGTGYSNDALLADHPDARERILFLDRLLTERPELAGGEAFLTDKQGFIRLRSWARREALEVLLEEHDYYTCMERGFRYYLQEDRAEDLLYYIAESLRRYLYVHPDQDNEGFLTLGFEKHFPKGRGILNDLYILLRDSTQVANLTQPAYADSANAPFQTNGEALLHFLNRAHAAGIVEAELSRALYFRSRMIQRDSALTLYIENGGKHRVFAETMMKNRLDRTLKKGKSELLMLEDIDLIEDHTYGYHVREVLAERKGPVLANVLRSMVARKFPQKVMVDVADMRANDLPAYHGYVNVLSDMFLVQRMKEEEQEWAVERERVRGSRARKKSKPAIETQDTAGVDEPMPDDIDADDLKRRKRTSKDFRFYFVDPGYWEFMVDKGYRTIEAIKVTGFDDRTKVGGNVAGVLLFLYPPYWYTRVGGGSPRYAFRVQHIKLDATKHAVRYRDQSVSYRLSKANMKSAVYESLWTLE